MERCNKCLFNNKNIVIGEGNWKADLVLIGEAPGEQEDIYGRPFIGRSGQELRKILRKLEIDEKDIFITNILQCRPPNNRKPTPHEIQNCLPFLYKKLQTINPKVIITLGSVATNTLLSFQRPITLIRGKIHNITINNQTIIVIPTLHPSYCLRNRNNFKLLESDIKKAKMWIKIWQNSPKKP